MIQTEIVNMHLRTMGWILLSAVLLAACQKQENETKQTVEKSLEPATTTLEQAKQAEQLLKQAADQQQQAINQQTQP